MPDNDYLNPFQPNHGSTWAQLDHFITPIHWDWPGWLPHDFLTVLASEPGIGKSFLALTIAASYIDGRPWPDATPFTAARGPVLWAETESGHRMHRQRLRAMGLDPSQIVSPLDSPLQNVNLNDKKHVYALLSHARRDDVRLVVLDSLTGLHAHGRQARSRVESASGLAAFATVARKPFLITHHLHRRPHLDRDGHLNVERLLGSPVLARVARVVWLLHAPDPADPGQLCLTMVKNNLAPLADPIGVRIDAHGPHFGPPPQPPSPPAAAQSQEDRAAALLKDLLTHGPLPVTQIYDAAQTARIAIPTLKRAKSRLGVKSNKQPNQWTWELPPD